MKNKTTKFRNAFLVMIFCLLNIVSYGQTKAEALTTLRDIFSKHFIKNGINKKNNKSHDIYYFDYNITENCIIIGRTISNESQNKNDIEHPDWVIIPYNEIKEYYYDSKKDYFEKMTSLTFIPSFGQAYYINDKNECSSFSTLYIKKITFPFNLKKSEGILANMLKAIGNINGEDKKNAQISKQKVE